MRGHLFGGPSEHFCLVFGGVVPLPEETCANVRFGLYSIVNRVAEHGLPAGRHFRLAELLGAITPGQPFKRSMGYEAVRLMIIRNNAPLR